MFYIRIESIFLCQNVIMHCDVSIDIKSGINNYIDYPKIILVTFILWVLAFKCLDYVEKSKFSKLKIMFYPAGQTDLGIP